MTEAARFRYNSFVFIWEFTPAVLNINEVKRRRIVLLNQLANAINLPYEVIFHMVKEKYDCKKRI